jgi:hypothetical protein
MPPAGTSNQKAARSSPLARHSPEGRSLVPGAPLIPFLSNSLEDPEFWRLGKISSILSIFYFFCECSDF